MGNRVRMRHLGVALLALVGAGCGQKEPMPEPPIAPLVLSATAERVETPVLTRRGTVSVGSHYRLGFSLPGVVTSVCCRTGDTVKRGQVIATLRANEATERLHAAAAARAKASRDYENASALVQSGALAPNAHAEAKNLLEAAEAQTALASEVLQLTKLSSPITGTVQQRLAEPGETIGPAMPVLIVEEVGKLVVRVGVTEVDLKRIELGQAADLSFDRAAASLKGRIANIAPVPDPLDGLFSVEIRPDTRGPELVPGRSTAIRFCGSNRETRVRIPLEALVERRGKAGVFLLPERDAVGKTRWKDVVVKRVDGKFVWLDKGLDGGEWIVAEGAYFLEDGTKVRVAEREVNSNGS